MSYNGNSKRIKNALMAMLTAIQYDAGGGAENAFAQVLDNSRNIFDGYPNAQVLPGDITVERPTTGQADKAPAYIVRIRIPLESLDAANETRTPDEIQSAAYDQMYDLTDLVIDAVDQADHDASLTDDAGLISITMMDATRGDWLVVTAADGSVLLCDVNLAVSYSRNLY